MTLLAHLFLCLKNRNYKVVLFDGENIEITYIDQAQAYGERDVRVVKEVKVTSAGALFAKK